MTKLLDIIDKHDCYGCESNFDLQFNRRTDDQIVNDVKKLILGIIGEDEPVAHSGIDDGDYDDAALIRNELRWQLRKEIEEL